MMTLTDEFCLADHLVAAGRDGRAIGPRRWRLVAGRAKPARGVVTQRGDWLGFEFPWRTHGNAAAPESLIELASFCGTLPELLKIARDHAEPVFDLRAELRLGDGTSGDGFGRGDFGQDRNGRGDDCDEPIESVAMGRRIDALLESFDRTLDASDEGALATGAGNGPNIDAVHNAADNANSEPLNLARLCGEAGWSCHERPHGRVAVPLDVSGLYCEALVAPRADGGFEAAYTVDAGERSFLSAAASSLFLLRANRVSRMARLSMTYSPAADSAGPVDVATGPVDSINGNAAPPARRSAVRGESGRGGPANGSTGDGAERNGSERDGSPWDRPRLSGVRFRWDVVLPGPVDANDLGVALSALSAACRSTVRELQVLAGDQLARNYLAAQGVFS